MGKGDYRGIGLRESVCEGICLQTTEIQPKFNQETSNKDMDKDEE